MTWTPPKLHKASAPYEKESETSYAAAQSVLPTVGTVRNRVYITIFNSGTHGLTDEEVETATGLKHQTASARRRELWQAGLIGTESERYNTTGRLAQVWKVARYCNSDIATQATYNLATCPKCGHRFGV